MTVLSECMQNYCVPFSLLTKKATVSVTVDEDLSIVNNSLPESGVLTIFRGSSASFNLKLRPRAIGQLTVTVSAVGDHGERDTVRKLLNVKVQIMCLHSICKNEFKQLDCQVFYFVMCFVKCKTSPFLAWL